MRELPEWIGKTDDQAIPPRVENLAGRKFGFLTVKGLVPNSKPARWVCVCDCGETRTVIAAELKRMNRPSCGCKNPTAKKDLSGRQFCAWTVLRQGRTRLSRRIHWICKCVCGVEREVAAIHLIRGASKSCGCQRPSGKEHHGFKHGSDPDLYGIWCNIIQRCENTNNPGYKDYGGRGVKICDTWRRDFLVFASDMGKRPSQRHQIDRIDNNRGYEPGNCRWATPSEQMRNTRRNRIVEYQGKTMPLIEAVEQSGVNYGTAKWRLDKGIPDAEALK